MSNDDEAIKRRYREFLDLLPLAEIIAGLPVNTGNRSLNAEQMDARAHALVTAFKLARQTVREIIRTP